jgi:hypothetical protein
MVRGIEVARSVRGQGDKRAELSTLTTVRAPPLIEEYALAAEPLYASVIVLNVQVAVVVGRDVIRIVEVPVARAR